MTKNYINHLKIEHVVSAKQSRTEENLNLEFSGERATREFVFNAAKENPKHLSHQCSVQDSCYFVSFYTEYSSDILASLVG